MAKKRSTRNHFELKNLKKHREELGLSLDDFANGLSHSTSKSTIFQYENGYCAANGDILYDISKTYNISIDYLYGFRNAKDPSFDFEQTCHYSGLSENSLKLLNYFTQAEPDKVKLINFLLEEESKDYLVRNKGNTYTYQRNESCVSSFFDTIKSILESDNLTDADCLKKILFNAKFIFGQGPDFALRLYDLVELKTLPQTSDNIKKETVSLLETRLNRRLEKLSEKYCKQLNENAVSEDKEEPSDNTAET